MTDANYGPLWAFTDVEHLILTHFKTWLPQWLAARERKVGLIYNTIARPKSYIVKQTFGALPGEEQTPLVIFVSDGFSANPSRRGTGIWNADLHVAIAVMCMASGEGKARDLCGHYQAALLGVALKHKIVDDDGFVFLSEFVNLKVEDIDEESSGRSLAAVRMNTVYTVNGFVEDLDPPDFVAPPSTPDPDDPIVEEVIIEVDNVSDITGGGGVPIPTPGLGLFSDEFSGDFG